MMRKNQKGFTLVELIIAIAILAIVTLAVCGFIVVGSKSYTSANTDILLQQEAQLALNQISDVIIDTTDSISYSVGTSSSLQNVLKDSEYGGEATDKCLVVVNRNDTSSNNDNPSYWFYWNKDEEKIHFSEVNVDSTMSADEIQAGFNNAASSKAVLAEHVTDLNIDISQFEENRVVMISMTLKNGNREYYTSNNVTVRNRIALNVVDIDPMKRADEFRIEDISSVILEPGDDYKFIPTVVTDSDDKELVWEFVSGQANGTTIAQSGNECSIHVGIDEIRENITLRVTRKNEEYAGQKDRVAESVVVKVKRVNSVNLTASASTVKAGETVEITGKAVGWQLKYPCNGDGCGSDDISKDADLNSAKDIVTGWHFVEGTGTIESSDAGKAVIKVDPSMTGGTVTIEATSTLSMNKHGGYSSAADTNKSADAPGVQGRISFTVEAGVRGDAPIASGYKFGTDNDDTGTGPVNMIYDYMYDDLPIGTDNAVVCARVRERGASNKDNDQVILYWTEGKNIRFYPDMFGLELTRTYDFYMQIIVPVQKQNVPENNYVNQNLWESDDQIKTEYYNNLDAMGKYVGSNYYASRLYYGTITPPLISIKLNGINYPNSNENLYESYHFNGGDMSRVMNKITFGDVLNVKYQTLENNHVRFAIYKNVNGNWVWDGGYNASKMAYDSKSFANNVFTINTDGNLTGDPFMQRGQGTDLQQACGTYHITVGYEYANIPDGQIGRTYHFIDKRNIRGDFALHYYEQPDCTITFKVDMGNNLQLPSENGQERWTFFPLPNDSAFPFALKSNFMQTASWYFTKYNSSGDSVWDGYSLGNLKVDCEYDSDKDSYTIWLYTESGRNGASYTRYVYGKYKCSANGNEWIPDRLGFYTEDVNIQTNIEFDKDNTKYAAYFPLPGKSDFPFNNLGNGEKATISYRLQVYDKNNNYEKHTETMTVECAYNGSTYTITLKSIANGGAHYNIIYTYGQWTCASGGDSWSYIQGASQKFEPIWGTVVTFTYNGNSCKLELPLPGTIGFPSSFPYEENVTEYFAADDDLGQNPTNPWGALKLIYTRNGDTYMVELVNGWNTSQKYATWTYTSGIDTTWR